MHPKTPSPAELFLFVPFRTLFGFITLCDECLKIHKKATAHERKYEKKIRPS